MKTKHFAVKIEKDMDQGKIRLRAIAKHFYNPDDTNDISIKISAFGSQYGMDAHIFDKHYIDKLRRVDTWGFSEDKNITYYIGILFDTGAEAQKWIHSVKRKLHEMESLIKHLNREIEMLDCS